MNDQYALSENKKRNQVYSTFLTLCSQSDKTVNDIAQLGYKLMRKEKLHHHFFEDFSLLTTAKYLAFYSLNLPYEYHNNDYLNKIINPKEAAKILLLFEKLIANRIPVEYITHETYYLGHQFYVNENVLVPRSIMNTRFNDFLNLVQWQNYRVLDLCTGSGCIGISLALLHPRIQVDLADISVKALEVAQTNIDHFALNDRVKCIQSDIFENIHHQYDLIITNPPYVATREYNASPAEFKNEPRIALEAGIDGLDVINKIITQARNYLNANGLIIAEVGFTTAKRVKKKYPKIPFKWFKYRRPSGKESLFGMHGTFMCEAKYLP